MDRIRFILTACGDRYERARNAGIGSNVDRRYRARRCGRATAAAGNAGRAGVHSSPQVCDHVLAAACFASHRFRRKRPAALASEQIERSSVCGTCGGYRYLIFVLARACN
jgi:hypothetical protein